MKELYYCEYSTRDKNIRTKFTRTVFSALTAAIFLLGTIGTAHAQTTVQVGTVTSTTSSYFPLYYFYSNNYTQTIYTAAELIAGGADASGGLITKIRYQATASASTTDWRDWQVFLGNTGEQGFDSTTDWIGIASTTEVFNGQIAANVTAGTWLEIVLTTPFVWDGSSNLVVAVKESTPSYGGNPAWAAYTLAPTTGNKGMYHYNDGTIPNPASPPTASGRSNTVAVMQFEVESLVNCAGIPDGGTTVLSPAQGNGGTPIVATVTGSSFGLGLTYQWQSSDDNGATWIDIPGETNGSLTTTSPLIVGETIDFRRSITCDGETSYSTPATYTTVLVYCTPQNTYGCGAGATLNGVSTTSALVNINNLGSGCTSLTAAGYSDYSTNPSYNLTVAQGTSFNIKADVSNYSGGVKVWIDLNKNGVFETSELVTASTGTIGAGNSHNGIIEIPPGTPLGETKMRVRVVESSTSFDACSTHSYGEAEDYKITIAEAPSCMPPSNLFVSDITPTSANLGWSENGTADLWNIEYGPAGFTQGDGTLAEGVDENPYAVTLTPETEYHFYVQADCGNGDESFWAGPYFFSNTYCTPTNSVNTTYFINSVITEGALTNINRTNTGFTAGGYANYSATDTLRVYPGQTISVTVGHPSSTYDYNVWIDWNGNYDFDGLDELVVNTGYVNTPHTFDLTIPLWADEVTTRLRIRNAYISSPPPACGEHGYGEVEDYTFVVVAPPSCYPVDHFQTMVITDNSIQIGWDVQNTVEETSWNLEYGPTGYLPGEGTSIVITENPYTITGLDDNTSYDIKIQAICEAEDLSYWASLSGIYTKCLAVPMPFFETFEEDSPNLNCWENEYVTGGANWTYQAGSSGGALNTAFQGERNARFVGVSGNFVTKLVSPLIDISGQDSTALTFAYAQPNWGSQNTTKVFARTENDAEWIELKYYGADVPNWKLDTIFIKPDGTELTGNLLNIAFEGTNNYGYANVIDDVKILPCSIEPGVDGFVDVCRLDQEVDLFSVITTNEEWGRWVFPANQTLVNGSMFKVSTLPSGTYQVHYILESPCASDTTIANITVFNKSSAGIGSSITVCEGKPIALYTGLSGNVDAGGDWYDYNGSLLGTSQPYAPMTEGSYNYTYITSNGICPADTAVVEVIVDCDLAIGEEIMSNVSIYPNPTSNVINVMNPSNLSALKIEMFDMNGRVVLVDNKSLANSDLGSINIEKLETGIYTLRVYNDEGQKTFKVVKQ